MGSPGHLDSDARVDGEAMPIDEGVGQSWVIMSSMDGGSGGH